MKCVKCGTELSETALVCHACGHLLPRADDLQMAPAAERPRTTLLSDLQPDDTADLHPPVPGETEIHDFSPDRRWQDYYLPGIFLAVGLVTYLTILWLRFGSQGIAFVGTDIAVALALELPLAVAIVAVTGTLFRINFGLLGPGVLKLAALNIAQRGLALGVAWIVLAGMSWQGAIKGEIPPEIPSEVQSELRGEQPDEEKMKLRAERQARERARFQAILKAAFVALIGVAFLIWFLMTTFDLSFSELVVLWAVNLVFSALLYAGSRFLFVLPQSVF